MKIATLVSSVLTVLLMTSTMICGLWMKSNNITDPSSFGFHTACGIASVVFSIMTLTLMIAMLTRMKRRG